LPHGQHKDVESFATLLPSYKFLRRLTTVRVAIVNPLTVFLESLSIIVLRHQHMPP
jgi:hypothetical protein